MAGQVEALERLKSIDVAEAEQLRKMLAPADYDRHPRFQILTSSSPKQNTVLFLEKTKR